jgi:hypothetical protein
MAEQGFVRRKCDYCNESQEFPSQTAQFTPAGEAQLKGWITLVRIFPVRGQLQPVQMHACKDSCATNIISLGMLDLPKEVKDMLAEDERRNADLQNAVLSQKSNSKTERPSPIDLPQLSQEAMLRAYSEVFKHAVRIESKDYGREMVIHVK